MKKILLMLAFLITMPAAANEIPPKYLEDGVITVTLKSGKQYTFSANEYFVAKRGVKKVEIARAPQINKPQEIMYIEKKSEQKRLKHIISGEVVRSNNGQHDVSSDPSRVNVESKKAFGVGVQYQYNIYKDVYMGGRLDSNGGTGLSLGLGF